LVAAGKDVSEWAKKNTIQCEVVKVAMAQDRNGHILKVSIHPNDLPKDLILDPLGSRYVMVLAKLGDNDEVVQPKEKSDGEKAVDVAGLLCRNDRFIAWMAHRGYSGGATAQDAVQGIRDLCGIKSRAELATNESARDAFNELRKEFETAVKKGEVPK
jgi:hypothetical protein